MPHGGGDEARPQIRFVGVDATLDDIGQRLGISKSWACRLHAKSLEMVRELLEGRMNNVQVK